MKNLMSLYQKIYNVLYWNIYSPLLNCFFRFYLKSCGVSYGKNTKTSHGLPIINYTGGHISLGDNVVFNNYAETSWYCKCDINCIGGAIKIGNNVGMNGCSLYCKQSITVGDFTMIGGGTRIIDTDFHPIKWEQRRKPELRSVGKISSVTIGKDVFIGTNCVILKGVSIGDRSVIAAGSVVVKDIPSDVIAGGNPCKVIKSIN